MATVADYYYFRFGAPARKAKYVTPEGIEIFVLKWDESQTNEGVTIYATLGASNVLGAQNESCEFFIGLTPEVDSIAEALAETALHGNGAKHIPNSGDTTTLTYCLWKGTTAKTFMFSNGDDIIPPIQEGLPKRVRFIQLTPLFDNELEYKKAHGERSLWGKFEASEVAYWDSARGDAFL
ncbi:suppressor of fused domain protein [Hahella sp. HN01]|uniref:suppressor of fused domain protein n=1 Tax=Hahella sp. HN01 TaxID=2847262 RepID=UPI001C1E961D|nr:suppressor of fused domain protein [Hahella sp. HN01]MBU6953094.1 suppressor of fused domain protein [Hahella sp. HN01]